METTCDPCKHAKTSTATRLSEEAGEADTARVNSERRLDSRRSGSRAPSPLTDTWLSDLPNPSAPIGASYEIHQADALTWIAERADNSFEAIVTDPPSGSKEYMDAEQTKMRSDKGGVCRMPSLFDGAKRMDIPPFTKAQAYPQPGTQFRWRHKK